MVVYSLLCACVAKLTRESQVRFPQEEVINLVRAHLQIVVGELRHDEISRQTTAPSTR